MFFRAAISLCGDPAWPAFDLSAKTFAGFAIPTMNTTILLLFIVLALAAILILWLILRPRRKPRSESMHERFNFDAFKGREQSKRGLHDRTKF